VFKWLGAIAMDTTTLLALQAAAALGLGYLIATYAL